MELESYGSINKDPDYKLEIFWYSYKCFFLNFYSKYTKFKRDTDSWSHTLNVLKKLKEFKPEFLIFSAGFDAHQDDPLAQFKLKSKDFYEITRRTLLATNKYNNRKVF